MHGASYCGSTQFLAAACGHPALKAIAPEVVAFDYFTPMVQREGVPTLALFNWACACTYNNLGMTEDNPRPKYDDAHVAWKERDIIALGRPVHFWRQMTNPQAFDTYFKGMDANEFRISMVMQELGVIGSLPAGVNVFLGRTGQFAKGGVVVGLVDQFKVPVRYIGTGEGISDIQPFDRASFVDALFQAEDIRKK